MYRLFAVCLFKSLPCPDVCRVFFLPLPSFIVYRVSILVIAVQYTLPCVYLARNMADDTLPCSIPNIHTAEYSITVALDFPVVLTSCNKFMKGNKLYNRKFHGEVSYGAII
jgi:hypothetical protein